MGVKLPFFRHRAAPFTQEAADEADLILAMQEQHLEEIAALAPNAEEKASTLKGYASGKNGYTGSEEYDIEDPFRQPIEVYEEAAEEIRQLIQKPWTAWKANGWRIDFLRRAKAAGGFFGGAQGRRQSRANP